MRHIMVLNSKGGCGKSTLATNIASYFATQGAAVALADYDPQRRGGAEGARPEPRATAGGRLFGFFAFFAVKSPSCPASSAEICGICG